MSFRSIPPSVTGLCLTPDTSEDGNNDPVHEETMNVLIVEDSNSARKLLRITFEHYGCTVIEAVDGVEGLDLASRAKPDIIISDALMPRMDGFQLLRALKSDPALSPIPFIFYTSTYTADNEADLARSLGAAAHVVKPVEPEALWQKVCEVIKGWESRRESPACASIDGGEEQFLREYSRIVATKLEEKVLELEETLALRQKAENDLKEQERELSTIFENAPFMMLLLDQELKIRRANGNACLFAGAPATGLAGLRSGEALHCIHAGGCDKGCGFDPHCRDCVIIRTVRDTGETGQSHHQMEAHLPVIVNEKEQSATLLLSTTRVMVAHQSMVLLSIQDISEYKKLESQLYHVQKMESIGALAGGIAHDFNNILTVIAGYGDITLKDMGGDDPLRKNIEHILQAARRATSLAQNLLLFSRKQTSDKKTVDLNEIVRSVDSFLRRVIGENIDCTVTPGDGTMLICADAHQLEQVLMNLAINARDAMPGGGSLSVSTSIVHIDETFITAHGYGNPGAYAVLTVTDTGSGMDEDTRLKIFEPFFTTKEIGKGTGLGLAVVYGIIKHHDGYITVHSKPGWGTTFMVHLPLTASTAPGITRDSAHEAPVRGSETILFAEDDEAVRTMVESLLDSFGYEVIAAVDGEDAVQKFCENRERIKLLLFDVLMPKKSGAEAYDEIIAIKPGVKVIFASGYANEAVHQKAQTDNNVVSITKPYLPSNLLTIVRNVLDK